MLVTRRLSLLPEVLQTINARSKGAKWGGEENEELVVRQQEHQIDTIVEFEA